MRQPNPEQQAAHLKEAAWAHRKASRAKTLERRRFYRGIMWDAFAYTIKWGACGADCRKAVAPYRVDYARIPYV